MKHRLIKIAGQQEVKNICHELQSLMATCGTPFYFNVIKIDNDEYLAIANNENEHPFGYICINASSTLVVAYDAIKVALYGGSDKNYISNVSMMRRYGNDWESRIES